MGEPSLQTMAMMQAFPNLMNFSKSGYKYEHYLVSTELANCPRTRTAMASWTRIPLSCSTCSAPSTRAWRSSRASTPPCSCRPTYDWYPPLDDVEDVATMKLPDGSFMKLFLSMGIQQQLMEQLPQDQWTRFRDYPGAVGNYPAFSNGVTLGGHGIAPNPKQNALGGSRTARLRGMPRRRAAS